MGFGVWGNESQLWWPALREPTAWAEVTSRCRWDRVSHPRARPAEWRQNSTAPKPQPLPGRPQHCGRGEAGGKGKPPWTESRHFTQTLAWAHPAAAWAGGRGDGRGKAVGLAGAWQDRTPGEGAWAALGRDVHQAGA